MSFDGGGHGHLHSDTIATGLAALLAGLLAVFSNAVEGIDMHIELILQWLTGISLIFLIIRHIIALVKGRP